MQTSANGPERQTDWHSVDWRKANRLVRNLRQRIFRASQAGDLKKAHALQKLMLRSYSNTLLSVRRVTQVNKGKNTAGVDKLVIKTPEARGRLVDHLMTFQPWTAKAARRVYIPKAHNKLRPLSIPSVVDRCLQARVKQALEPFWEARFERSSYGFRPGRSCHDAIARVFSHARPDGRKKWVVDADIMGAFDNIAQPPLLDAIGSFPARALIRQWLKAGYVDKSVFHETDTGTGQGSVVSPLLANIALHGMEEALGISYDHHDHLRGSRALVRYADDWVVFCESKDDAEEVIAIMAKWLAQRGLTLSAEKTRIVHLREGFDFLGYNVRHYPAPQTSRSGYKLLIRPNKDAIQQVRQKLRAIWGRARHVPLPTALRDLNAVIRGWANYHRIVVARDIFRALDQWLAHRAYRYTKRHHPHKSWRWCRDRYWGRLNAKRDDRWVFGDTQTGSHLLKFRWFPIERHVLIRGAASPDDPTLRDYWRHRRQAHARNLSVSERKLATAQHGLCPVCGDSLFNDEELQTHHLTPRAQGGKDVYTNLTLVHLYCHHQIHGGPTRTICEQQAG